MILATLAALSFKTVTDYGQAMYWQHKTIKQISLVKQLMTRRCDLVSVFLVSTCNYINHKRP